jgi:hypothetical protein
MKIEFSPKPKKPELTFEDLQYGDVYKTKTCIIKMKIRCTGTHNSICLVDGVTFCEYDTTEVEKLDHVLTIT